MAGMRPRLPCHEARLLCEGRRSAGAGASVGKTSGGESARGGEEHCGKRARLGKAGGGDGDGDGDGDEAPGRGELGRRMKRAGGSWVRGGDGLGEWQAGGGGERGLVGDGGGGEGGR